jgi:hypothetical protein
VTRTFPRVVLGLTLTGAVIGALWAWIAPPIHAIVALTKSGERVHDYLGNESQHFFDAPCLLLGLLTLVAIVAPVLTWQWRESRGPGAVVGLVVGLLTGTAAAAAVGTVLVRVRYGALNFDTVALSGGEHKLAYVVEAPPVFFSHALPPLAATFIWPVGIAALVYAAMAAGSARDDLGGRPVAAEPAGALPVEPEASLP